MASWRTILVAKPCKLSAKNLQLVYEPKDDAKITLPLEDISVIVIETHQAIITTALLSAIAEKNIALFSCDNYHIPNGVFNPFHQHSRLSQIAHLQQKTTLPFKKKIWQKIITRKIENQSKVLQKFNIDSFGLDVLKNKVKSGDSDNLEAQAARRYWSLLFENFRRDQKAFDPINVALNYAYAIVRGVVARSLVSYGLLPTFGVFHHSELNAFNLADDMIEPLRPMVDIAVKRLALEDTLDSNLTPQIKSNLISVIHSEMILNSEVVTLLHVSDVMAKSLVSAMRLGDTSRLSLPTLV